MNNFTTNLLEIKDPNIKIIGENAEEVYIEGQKHKIVHGQLTYYPEKCERCNRKNTESIIKDGFSKECKVKLLPSAEIPTMIILKKQNFKCKKCNKKFTAQTSLVKKHSNISKNVRTAVLNALTKTQSFKEIAERYNISINTVIRILQSCKKQVETNCYKDLPEHLCFDEIKSTKDSKNGMSFVFMNALTHEFIDIVDGRTQFILNDYFLRFKRSVKNKVKTICIDIYPPYMEIIKRHFPNAEIIIDRFHIVQNLNRELNKTRITVMNRHKGEKGSIYTLLKNNWKLFLEDSDKVSHDKLFYNKSLKRYVTKRDLLEYLLAVDEEFRASYERVQEIRKAVKDRNKEELERLIEEDTTGLSKGVAKAVRTMKKHKKYMLNSVKYEFSNGPLEGFNNKIKLLKRVSYGYSSFRNFRLRILVMSRLFVDSKYNKNFKVNKKSAKRLKVA